MLKISNLQKPSNKKAKLVADFLLYSLPAYLVVILSLPISENTKLWINAGVTIVIVSIKGLSKFTSQDV